MKNNIDEPGNAPSAPLERTWAKWPHACFYFKQMSQASGRASAHSSDEPRVRFPEAQRSPASRRGQRFPPFSASQPSLPFPLQSLVWLRSTSENRKKIAQVRKLKNETLHYCAFSKTPRSESGWAGDTEQGKGTQLRTVKKYRREIHSWTCATSLMDVMSSLYKKSFDDLRALWQCL